MTAFGFDNRILTGVVTVEHSVAGLGAAQLQDPHGAPGSAWQTPSGTTLSHIYIDSGATGTTWRLWGLHRTNLTAAATWRIRVSNAADYSSPTYLRDYTAAAVAPGIGQAVHLHTATVTGRYCSISVSDATNPDGFLNVPLAYAGPAWVPANGLAYDSADAEEAEQALAVTRGGQEYPELRFIRRGWEISLPAVLDVTERRDQLAPMLRWAALGRNVLAIPRADGDPPREAVFGLVRPMGRVGWQSGVSEWRAARLQATERL